MTMFTLQEQQVQNYLLNKSNVYWEELAQFCKVPSNVKLGTVQKIVSNIKAKYRKLGEPPPFNCKFAQMEQKNNSPQKQTIEHNGQRLVKLERRKLTTSSTKELIKQTSSTSSLDFIFKRYQLQVLTKSGHHQLNSEEFDILEYFYNNAGRPIFLNELRDKVCFHNYGSKLPARWFDSIQRRIGLIKRNVPEARKKLLTIRQIDGTSAYMLNVPNAKSI